MLRDADLMAFVPVSDLDRARRFYEGTLGLEVCPADDFGCMVAASMASGVIMQRYEGMGQDDAGIWGAPSGDRVAWFSDSEGNTLSLTQPG
jgi:predicted enzyme related to lactoylglutathione lyase